MRVAYVTTYDPSDLKAWSGLGHHIAKALINQDVHLDFIGPLKEKFSKWLSLQEVYQSKVRGKKFKREREPMVNRYYAKQVGKKLKQLSVDIVFSPSTLPIAFLECTQPIVFWTDATFNGMVDFYPMFTNLCNKTIRNGNMIEQKALEKASAAIYTSEWAAQSAVQDYNTPNEKIAIIPFGANFEGVRQIQQIENLIDNKPMDRCHLLFIGTEWYRKGGDIALELSRSLNRHGLPTELRIVGCAPDIQDFLQDDIVVYGFLDKKKPEESELLSNLFETSHFLVLPSRAECTPVVFSEANSYGLPCLSTTVGGIPSIIRSGVNGMLSPLGPDIHLLRDYVLSLFKNCQHYRDAALASFHEYDSRLNWNAAGQRVSGILERLLGGSPGSLVENV